MNIGKLEHRPVAHLQVHTKASIVPDMSADRFVSFLADVKEHGIKLPLDILPDGTILDGRHRFKAATQLGIGMLPVRVLDLGDEDPVEFMFRAGTQRRDLTADQRGTMSLEMSRYREARDRNKKAQVEAGQKAGIERAKGPRDEKGRLQASGNVARSVDSSVFQQTNGMWAANQERKKAAAARETRAQLAAEVGVSPRTIQAAIAVREAAKTMPAVAAMLPRIKAGEVSTGDALKLVKLEHKRELAEKLRAEPVPFSKGPYRVIVSDPPWQYQKRAEDITHRGRNPYPDMSTEQICALPVQAFSHDDAVLWLWTTNAFMRDAFLVLDAWGFKEKTILTWVKDRMGTGDWLRGRSEHCIMAIRGKPLVTLTNQTTVMSAPMREHSRKPDEFYAMVEELCPGGKLEMFSRETREGWASWGAEAEKFAAGIA